MASSAYSHYTSRSTVTIRESISISTKQLHDAINLLVVCWNTVLGEPLKNIKAEIEQYSYKEPYLRQIKAVDTIISRDRRRRTLRKMLDELSVNNNIRNFSFDALNRELEKHGKESHFG